MVRFLCFAFVIALLFSLPAFAAPASSSVVASVAQDINYASGSGTEITLGGVKGRYWAPAPSTDKQPIILFSHAWMGCPDQSPFLTEALAQDGYWVFAPEHADHSCIADTEKAKLFPYDAQKWNDKTFADRRDDMLAFWKALQSDPQFKDKIDFTKLGLAGHMLGGYDVMALAGAWPSWKMPGVKAVLAITPYAYALNIQNMVGKIDAPIMFQTGTNDKVESPSVLLPKDGSYLLANAPKYLVNFRDAGYLTWVSTRSDFYSSILYYTLAFFDHYVKGQPPFREMVQLRPNVQEIKYESELGKGDLVLVPNGNAPAATTPTTTTMTPPPVEQPAPTATQEAMPVAASQPAAAKPSLWDRIKAHFE
ncbi:MAG TPA: dienelactone hydrolase family protein [Alphaproteobacteria bacterium]|nr:dienelactone hydrolase family protein [Alphaproteobacteria bacterium]